MKFFTLGLAALIATCLMLAGCSNRLPPNTSFEGKAAVRGNQLVQAMRASIPTVKLLTCTSGTPVAAVPTCITPAVSVRVFEGMETAFKAAEQAADALRSLDAAKTEVEASAAKTKALAVLEVVQKTLTGLTIMPETEGARNALVQALSAVMSILVSIGSFGAL